MADDQRDQLEAFTALIMVPVVLDICTDSPDDIHKLVMGQLKNYTHLERTDMPAYLVEIRRCKGMDRSE